jgi:hypothetical protein
VKEMFKRGDENATSLLHVITQDCISVDQLLLWWYLTQLAHSGLWYASNHKNAASLHSHAITTQYHTNALFEEIVRLWRLAALNPQLSHIERTQVGKLEGRVRESRQYDCMGSHLLSFSSSPCCSYTIQQWSSDSGR